MTEAEFKTRLLLLGVSCEVQYLAPIGRRMAWRFFTGAAPRCHDNAFYVVRGPAGELLNFSRVFTQITDALAEQEDKS